MRNPLPALLLALSAVAAGSSAHATTLRSGSAHALRVPQFNHVFVIIGENTSASDVNRQQTPYLAGTLMPEGAVLTDYDALHGGSLSDYMGMTAGNFGPCDVNDNLPYNPNTNRLACDNPNDNIFHLLDQAGMPWTEWGESMPNPCGFIDVGTDWAYNVYTTHHNPAVYFDDVEGRKYNEGFNARPSDECLQRVVPMGSTAPDDTSAFDLAVAGGNVAQFNFIVPNDCENGHDLCGTRGRVRQFDDFLAREVPKILTSPVFGTDGLLIVTYDEWGDKTLHDKRVAFVAVGPLVLAGSTSGTHYNHYSLLRTLEDGYRLQPYLGHAATATSITGIWAPAH